MNYIRQLFPKSRMRLPAAALAAVVGLAFACSEVPTEATPDGVGASFAKGGNKGGKTNDCGFTALSIAFDETGNALRSDNGNPYVEGESGGVHLNGATGRLMLWTSQYGDPPRGVEVSTSNFMRSTTDRIYTNGHETENDQADLGCGFLQMPIPALDPEDPEFVPTVGSAVLEVEMDAEGIVRWGKDCDGNPVDDERVTTTRIDESTWTVEGVVGVSCKYGPKVRGKRELFKGTAGAFFMTLEKL